MKWLTRLMAKWRSYNASYPLDMQFKQWLIANRVPRYTIEYRKIIGRYLIIDQKLPVNRSQVVGHTTTYTEAQIIVAFFENGRL
jgi:hypothetical protein